MRGSGECGGWTGRDGQREVRESGKWEMGSTGAFNGRTERDEIFWEGLQRIKFYLFIELNLFLVVWRRESKLSGEALNGGGRKESKRTEKEVGR